MTWVKRFLIQKYFLSTTLLIWSLALHLLFCSVRSLYGERKHRVKSKYLTLAIPMCPWRLLNYQNNIIQRPIWSRNNTDTIKSCWNSLKSTTFKTTHYRHWWVCTNAKSSKSEEYIEKVESLTTNRQLYDHALWSCWATFCSKLFCFLKKIKNKLKKKFLSTNRMLSFRGYFRKCGYTCGIIERGTKYSKKANLRIFAVHDFKFRAFGTLHLP